MYILNLTGKNTIIKINFGGIIMKPLKYIILFLITLLILSGPIIAGSYTYYRVRKGDCLSKIADYFNLNTKNIISINNINNPNLLKTGQNLKIPVKKIRYKIKNGDTLSKIASNYNVKLKNLIRINNISNPDKIISGQVLMIPVVNKRRKQSSISRHYRLNFIWPVQGKISSSFGWRIHPISNKRNYHTGIDIATSIASPVYAAAEGVVVHSDWLGGYGKLIIIQHRNNKKTYYAHNIELLVDKGDRVKKGKVIALSGNSGRSTGPHLHFEIRTNNRVENPMKYLNKQYLDNGFRELDSYN